MKQEFYPTDLESDVRIDRYLAKACPELSRSYIQKLLKSGQVLVNGRLIKASYVVTADDHIEVDVPEAVEPEIEAEPMDLDILYEDQDIILVNKPKGMVVHPAAGHYSHTLVNGLMYHCKDQLSGINGVMRPGIVHRIDMDTTGVLIVCKNDMAHNSIAAQLKEHSITRRYQAIVHGVIKEDEGTVDAPGPRAATAAASWGVPAHTSVASPTSPALTTDLRIPSRVRGLSAWFNRTPAAPAHGFPPTADKYSAS